MPTNARINILSITSGCTEYICSSQFIGGSLVVLQRSPDPLVGWGGDEIWSVYSPENH